MLRKWIGFGIALGMLGSLAAYGEEPNVPAPSAPGDMKNHEHIQQDANAAQGKAEDLKMKTKDKKGLKEAKTKATKKAKSSAKDLTSPVTPTELPKTEMPTK